ncbi:MAG: tRNA (adenosine(37)-N6)-threonylcarbamoyltransferase complex dimerization subunit type 1 TsaB [Bacteroidetes bacterium]|nr:tRNA (adenosine(37)-N6)-threonylcarbamoyltransferase complex dimerization subunit type 1 TsaB [Bacteroidota bacterium]
MERILHLETTAAVCSVALSQGPDLVVLKEHQEANAHSKVLLSLVDQAMQQAGWSPRQLDAIALSAGPGSYTGLRIGSATAKGLCFALDRPLIAVDTLMALALGAFKRHPEAFFVAPMMDARRMEVYTAIYNPLLEIIFPPSAWVLVDNPYLKWLESGPVVFCGNGVEKAQNLLHHKHAIFEIQVQPSADNMVELAHKRFIYNQLEDLAYFEPHYLKAFWSPSQTKPRNI